MIGRAWPGVAALLIRVVLWLYPSRYRSRFGAEMEGAFLAQREALYRQARARHPRRWSGATRDWTPIGAVTLNARPQPGTHREAA